MKILLITGQLAGSLIQKNLKNYRKHEIYLKIIPVKIASFITPKNIIYHLKEKNMVENINRDEKIPLDNIEMIITPGLIRQDVEIITEQLNIPAYKGPSNAADIEFVLNTADKITLSTTKPADILIHDHRYRDAMNIINQYSEINSKTEKLLEKKSNTKIKNLPIGGDFPMRILAEIADAPALNTKQLLEKAEYYIQSGADMIDVGMHAGENNPRMAYRMIKTIKDNYDIPVSIDSLNPDEIKQALKAGADMVLSIDHGNYDKLKDDLTEYNPACVILPTNYAKNRIPQTTDEKIRSLEKMDERCSGVQTIADPLLDPINSPSLTESIITCYKYRKRNPDKLLFFGVGNVTELLDTDSNGANATLAGIASEIKANILFTPEASPKTRSSISELKKASEMMFIAQLKNTIPKNLGINLINYKDPYKKEDVKINTANLPHIKARADGKFKPDYKGSFKIILEDNLIKAILYKNFKKTAVITSTSARAIYEQIIRDNMISRIEHAAYLGMELEKAEIALKLKKQYIQDFPIF